MNKNISLLALAVLISFAQFQTLAQAQNWTIVKAVPKGIEVIVERKNDARVVGSVASVTDDTLVIISDQGSFVIGRDNITKIYHALPRDSKKEANRGALLGGLIGLGLGIGAQALVSDDSEAMPGPAVFIASGVVGGWLGSKRGKGQDKGALIYAAK